jgi:hypothetical protein
MEVAEKASWDLAKFGLRNIEGKARQGIDVDICLPFNLLFIY